MDNGIRRFTCARAKDIDLVDYLASLGIRPVRIRGNDFWYFSPFREERTASFKINRRINRWYDFGEGVGGNLLDFAIRYHDCTVGEVLQILSGNFSIHKPFRKAPVKTAAPSPLTVLKVNSLFSYSLLAYLRQRRIATAIADRYCKEVRFTIAEKAGFAIGFQNNSGGFELRSSFFKGSSSPKDITTVKTGANTLSVFEGFMDFLSFLTILDDAGIKKEYDFLILNSLSLFEKTRQVMEAYQQIHLYLDNDSAGKNCALYASSLSAKYLDKSVFYKNYKDLNEMICSPGSIAGLGRVLRREKDHPPGEEL
ncbi:MAG TPA: toprim domain-containing protein [Anseongella sp.]